jgi:hypothetical protein
MMVQQVVENTGCDLIVKEPVQETEPPTYEELRLLRIIDPTGIYIPRLEQK